MVNLPSIKDTTEELIHQRLAAGGALRLRVTTASMMPNLRAGDLVSVSQVDWRDLRVGDILLCKMSGALIAHRLLMRTAQRGQPMLITKGDHVWDFDAPHELSAYVGRVTHVARAGQSFALNSPTSRMCARAWALCSIAQALLFRLYRRVQARTHGPIGLAILLALLLLGLGVTGAAAVVTLSSFEAQGGQNQIKLTWTTATELRNFGFNLERSTNQVNWTKLGFVQSQSPCIQSLTTLAYEYTDSNLPDATKYYYRLQMVGNPCNDPDDYVDLIVSATTNGATPTATVAPSLTPSLQTTPTPSPSATRTAAPTATATNTASPLPTATQQNTPTLISSPSRTSSPPTATRTLVSATPTRPVVVPVNTPAPTVPEATSSSPAATYTTIAEVPPTKEPAASDSSLPSKPKLPSPTVAPAASSRADIGAVLLAGMVAAGTLGFMLLLIAGVIVWRSYVRR